MSGWQQTKNHGIEFAANEENLEEFQLLYAMEKIGRGEKEETIDKLADENESSIGYALHCSWQLVALLARGTN